jgi:hypothetical protein
LKNTEIGRKYMRKRTIIYRKELEEKEKTSITKKSRNQQGKF